METQFAGIAFVITILGLSGFEIRRLKTIITPFTVTALPFVAIVFLLSFVYIDAQITPISVRAIYFILFNLTLIWIVGFFFTRKIKVSSSFNKIDYFNYFSDLNNYKPLLILLAFAISMITFYRVYSIVHANGGWFFLGNYEYESLINSGPGAYLIVFGEAVFILLYLVSAKTGKKYISYTVLILLGISFFLLMVKFNLLWMIMMIFFIKNMNLKIKKQISTIIKTFSILIFIFVFHFVFLTIFWDTFSITSVRMWEFFYKTILNYFLTSPLVLDNWLNTPGIKPDWTLFAILQNIIYVVTSNPLRVPTLHLVSNGFENLGPGIDSNVGTSFGVYYLIGGIPFTIIMTTSFAILMYFVYTRCIRKSNVFFQFFSWFLLTLSSLSFFVQYFTILPTYIFPVSFFFLVALFRFMNKYKVARVPA